MRCRQLLWGEEAASSLAQRPDVLLGADLLYDPGDHLHGARRDALSSYSADQHLFTSSNAMCCVRLGLLLSLVILRG